MKILNERTAAVIMLCKGNVTPSTAQKIEERNLDYLGCLAEYMAKYTGMPVCYISVGDVKNWLRDAVIDYVGCCSNPGAFITQIFDRIDHGYDEMHAYISALKMVKVREDEVTYINGFTQKSTVPISF